MQKKSTVLKLIWGAVLVSWLLLIPLGFSGPELKTWTIGVTIVAVVTEIAFWLTALLLGVGMWESRKRIMGAILSPFRKS